MADDVSSIDSHRSDLIPFAAGEPPSMYHLPIVEALAAVEPLADELPETAALWQPLVEVASAPYSIRIPASEGEVDCPRCREPFLAAGPTGYAGEHPICDLCLLDGAWPLGMLFAMSLVVRTFGRIRPAAGAGYLQALDELAAFARVYEKVASKAGPLRPFPLPDLEAAGG